MSCYTDCFLSNRGMLLIVTGEDSHPISYANHAFGGSESTIFTVNALTGAVSVTSELNAEESDVLIVTISAKSDEDPMAVGYCQIEVSVTDVNDVTPIFTHAQSKFDVLEGSSYLKSNVLSL